MDEIDDGGTDAVDVVAAVDDDVVIADDDAGVAVDAEASELA